MHVERPSALCFCLLLNFTLFAQTTTLFAQTTPTMEGDIRAQIGSDSRLYNGREYIRNGTPAKGFPYFEWDSLKPGSLTYDGISYDIPIEYDLAQDQLVIRNYADNILISLVAEKTNHFSIGTFHFRYFSPGINSKISSGSNSGTNHLQDPGFYQELFTGSRVTLLARRHKNLVFPSTNEEQPQYVQINTYVLLLDGSSYKIGSEVELLNVLSDRKEELKKYIRKNHVSFKHHLEGSITQTIAYYQQLKS
jgi:hypothetical protein